MVRKGRHSTVTWNGLQIAGPNGQPPIDLLMHTVIFGKTASQLATWNTVTGYCSYVGTYFKSSVFYFAFGRICKELPEVYV